MISQAFCTVLKQHLFEGVHDFRAGQHVFKIALYTNLAALSAGTPAYLAANEVAGGGYTAGGLPLTQVSPTVIGTTGFVDFADVTWPGATITARGALIYNSTPRHTYVNPACAVLDFGSDKSSTAGDFTIQFPTPDAVSAILRIA
jgi:hypothetical protein